MTNVFLPWFGNVLTFFFFLKDVEGISLEVARKIITHEATGSRRVTKKALLESIGYGVSAAPSYFVVVGGTRSGGRQTTRRNSSRREYK